MKQWQQSVKVFMCSAGLSRLQKTKEHNNANVISITRQISTSIYIETHLFEFEEEGTLKESVYQHLNT